ncbi:outer membrane beta-barrel family protein, partial [Oceanihabitans sp.]|nr:outer membrane beta-barrel family protein [Oceanihabitans sp.]
DIEGTHGLSFGIRKDFLNKKLQIRATGSDIFRTETDYPYNSNYGGIQLNGTYTNDNQRFGLGATYKFGDQQSKTKKKTKSALDDELDRITN